MVRFGSLASQCEEQRAAQPAPVHNIDRQLRGTLDACQQCHRMLINVAGADEKEVQLLAL